MDELLYLLNNIEDAYFDFVSAMAHYAERKTSRRESLINFLKENPMAKSSDVVKFVSEQKDFYEDAEFMRAV